MLDMRRLRVMNYATDYTSALRVPSCALQVKVNYQRIQKTKLSYNDFQNSEI